MIREPVGRDSMVGVLILLRFRRVFYRNNPWAGNDVVDQFSINNMLPTLGPIVIFTGFTLALRILCQIYDVLFADFFDKRLPHPFVFLI